MTKPAITFIVPGDPNQRTGGYLYDARMVDALKLGGYEVDVVGLAGCFPVPDDAAIQAMHTTLMGVPSDGWVIFDGLAMGGLGDVLSQWRRAPAIASQRWIGLVHHPLADEQGVSDETKAWLFSQEQRSLSLCDQVIVTSDFTAERLVSAGYLASRPAVVNPGVRPAPLAKRAHSGQAVKGRAVLLCVASLTPRKGHMVLLQALANLKDHDWICQWVGSPTRDPAHASTLTQTIHTLGLGERIACLGELDERGLDDCYHEADLCVLPSHYEGYGMVVTEALARGLPMITTDGGALKDTLPAGAGGQVPAGDATGLASMLRTWFENPGEQQAWLRAARQSRAGLNDWSQAGVKFIEALGLAYT